MNKETPIRRYNPRTRKLDTIALADADSVYELDTGITYLGSVAYYFKVRKQVRREHFDPGNLFGPNWNK